jgi:hypothetical protein
MEQNLCLRQFLAIIEVFAVYIRLCRNNPDCSIASMKKSSHPEGRLFKTDGPACAGVRRSPAAHPQDCAPFQLAGSSATSAPMLTLLVACIAT